MRHLWQRAAAWMNRLGKSIKPDNLPMEHPATFELIINRTTANAFG